MRDYLDAIQTMVETAMLNAIDMVEPQAGEITRIVYDMNARWFVEVLWFNDIEDCWLRSWAHHKRKPFQGDFGFRSMEAAFNWCLRNGLRHYVFPPTGNSVGELRVRIYWSDTGPSVNTRTTVEVYGLGGDVV